MKKKISAEYKRKEKKRKREILVDKRKTIGENGKREGFLVIKKVARRCQKGNSSSKRKGVVRSSRKYDTRAPKKKKISTIIKREKKMKSIGTKSSYKKKKKKRKKKERKGNVAATGAQRRQDFTRGEEARRVQEGKETGFFSTPLRSYTCPVHPGLINKSLSSSSSSSRLPLGPAFFESNIVFVPLSKRE